MTDEKLSALLRLKRFEQPPAGYFDKLLQDVHRRQRADMLRQPLWKLALERVQTFFGEHSMGNLSYGGAMAGFVLLGFAAMGLLTPRELSREGSAGAVAAVQQQEIPAAANISPVALLALDNQTPLPTPELGSSPFKMAPPRATSERQPRYVIDARPASYEATTVSFNF